MYRRIVKNRKLAAAMVTLLLSTSLLPGLDQELVLGRADRWQDLSRLDRVALRPGRWGSLDAVLKDDLYQPAADTDLLIHFDTLPLADQAGHYQVEEQDLLLSREVTAIGEASGGFASTMNGVRLRAAAGALLHRGAVWADFSIELWLRPSLLGDGEEVLSWVGSRWQDGQILPQRITCTVQDRRLIWQFDNFFTRPTGAPGSFRLEGITRLIPRQWHHHLVRYDSTTGLLEYAVDGLPEATAYATDSGRVDGALLVPAVGQASTGELRLGRRYTGFMDELRISRKAVTNPVLHRYAGRIGTGISRTFDLGYTGTSVKTIQAVYDTPANSAVYFYYRLSDRPPTAEDSPPWRQFAPGAALEGVRGRYLSLMFELYPDGTRERSPSLSELRVVYQPDLPPAPPTGLYAEAGDGSVHLYWHSVNEQDVRGYRVYYGEGPGNYHGAEAQQGASPIDVGESTDLEISGLENGKLYYFSVVAYDAGEPPHQSLFAREVSARPSALFGR